MRRLAAVFALAASALAHGQAAEEVLPAQPGETVILPALRGVMLVPDRKAAEAPPPPGFAGADASRVPALRAPDLAAVAQPFLGKPVSLASLGRLRLLLGAYLQEQGHAYFSLYVPPQDLTDGVVRLVAAPARLEGEVEVEGATHFSAQHYRNALRVRPGGAIDDLSLQEDLEAINRNPFRNVVIAAQPGEEEGTTRLGLRVRDMPPRQFIAGYDNTGSALTGEHRLFAGITLGDAFGRGDLVSYQYKFDPEASRSKSHSLNYVAHLPSRHSLTMFGALSEVRPRLPAPLTQVGKSWQLGARYALPFGERRNSWKHGLTLGADFKFSDNTVGFADIPVFDNVTHVAQASLGYGLEGGGEGHRTRLSATAFFSPGGLTSRNEDRFFAASRVGAKARYAYARVDVQHQRQLPQGWSWTIGASLQETGAALIGSEQIAGGGSTAVRGYSETSAFGDRGVVVTNELHAPRMSLADSAEGSDTLAPFLFVDAARVRQNAGGSSTGLRSIGAGLSYQWGTSATLRAVYGRQQKRIATDTDKERLHLFLQLAF